MYSVGKLSLITRLSVKAIRLYHEKGLLIPDHIDNESGYRYYNDASVERALIIVQLKVFGLSLEQIGNILADCKNEEELALHLAGQKASLQEIIRQQQVKIKELNYFIESLKKKPDLLTKPIVEPVINMVEPLLFASHKMVGRYQQIGIGFRLVAKAARRAIAGPAIALHHDGEYREVNANFEAGFAVKQPVNSEEVASRTLPGVRVATLIHRGPYEDLGKSYQRLLDFMQSQQLIMQLPTREIYHRGPGMFFKGNSKKYITEIQIPFVKEEKHAEN